MSESVGGMTQARQLGIQHSSHCYQTQAIFVAVALFSCCADMRQLASFLPFLKVCDDCSCRSFDRRRPTLRITGVDVFLRLSSIPRARTAREAVMSESSKSGRPCNAKGVMNFPNQVMLPRGDRVLCGVPW
jgi:hypothetical protein